MATLTAVNADRAIRFDLLDMASLLAGTAITSNATTFTIGTDPDTFTAFSGSGFTFSGGLFTAGTINRIDSVAGGLTEFTLDGLSMTVGQFRSFVTAGNTQGFLTAALAGDDTLTGSAFDDYLQGFAGNDVIQNNPGNADNDTLDGGAGADAMDGGDGNDLYIIDNVKDSVTDSGGIDFVQSTVGFTLGAGLEHLFLTGSGALNGTGNGLANQIVGAGGANKLLGLDANDLLDGGAGNDTLDGGTGDDTMLGGAGNDTYFADSSADQAIEPLAGKAGGTDIVFSAADFTLGADIENLTLTGAAITGAGNDSNNAIGGNASGNVLDGGAGNDTLTGGAGSDTLVAGSGADQLNGGADDDIYVLDSAADKVTESLAGVTGGDSDTVQYSGSGGYVLGKNLETLVLIGAAVSGTGNELNNLIVAGNNLANILDGKAGADTLVGGGGNTVYIVDNASDFVDESGGDPGDVDTVKSSVNFDLGGVKALGDIEILTLLGAALVGSGNGLDNQIVGSAGANSLTGLAGNDTLDGGTGNDTLIGGDGNDLYIVDSKTDVVTESGIGTDEVDSAKVSVDISALGSVENIHLLGTMALNATGNAGNNVIIGNDGANKLFGLDGADSLAGGAGNDTLDGGIDKDTLAGGDGNDTYFVDLFINSFTADIVDESGGSGIDTVISSANVFDLQGLSLGAVENLTLAAAAGNAAGLGNGLANVLTGNGGNNLLNGMDGNDTINGGAGDDQFIGGSGDDAINVSAGNDTVGYRLAVDGHDVISGFDGNPAGGQDVLDLSHLFDVLSVPNAERASHVMVVDYGSTVDVRVDADLNLANGYELTAATIQTADAVTVGQDIVVS